MSKEGPEYKSVAERVKDIEASIKTPERTKRSDATVSKSMIDKFVATQNGKKSIIEKTPESPGYGIPKPVERNKKEVKAMDVAETLYTAASTGAKIALASNPVTLGLVVAAVAAEGVKGTLETKERRELYQEKASLDEIKACNSIKNELMDKHPALKNITGLQTSLKDAKGIENTELNIKNFKCKREQYPVTNKEEIITNIAKGVILSQTKEKSIDAIGEAMEAAKAVKDIVSSPDPVSLGLTVATYLKKGIDTVKSIKEVKEAYDGAMAANDAKIDINETKKHLREHDIRPYADKQELFDNARDKKIETAALVKLTEKENFKDLLKNPEKLQKAFEVAKKDVSKTIEGRQEEHGLKGFAKDFARGIKAGGSKYSGEVEFTKPKELEERFKNQGFERDKTSGERFKEGMKDILNPEYKVSEEKTQDAKQLLKGVTMLDKSRQEDPYAVNLKHFQKEAKTIEHDTVTTRPRSNAVDLGKQGGKGGR